MKNFIFITLILFSISVRAQFIYAFAGCDTSGFSGDGGQATAATIDYPFGMAVDGSGSVYFSDAGNNRIRRINAAGVIHTIAGNGILGYRGDGGPADSAELNTSQGIAIDNAGNVYVSDQENNRIRKIDTSGIITTVAGNGIQGFSGDNGPATLAKLNRPMGIAVDGSGNIYIVDAYNERIRKVNTSGTITTIAGNGTYGYGGDGGPATDAVFRGPYGISVDDTGNVYFSDNGNSCIRKVNTSGTITVFAGVPETYGYSGDGASANTALFFDPRGIAIDGSGNMYIADYGNFRVREVDISGIVSTVAGKGVTGNSGNGGPADSAEFWNVFWVAAGNGNIYLADCTYSVIRKVGWLTGVSQISATEQATTIYPNPVSTSLTVATADKIFNIIIYNFLGQKIYDQAFDTTNAEVNVANLSTGVYFIQVNGIEVRKFVKE